MACGEVLRAWCGADNLMRPWHTSRSGRPDLPGHRPVRVAQEMGQLVARPLQLRFQTAFLVGAERSADEGQGQPRDGEVVVVEHRNGV